MNPKLIVLSPILIDQSFPRDSEDLLNVAVSLGNLTELLQHGDIIVLLTNVFVTFIEDTCFQREDHVPLVLEIYRYLQQISLVQNTSVRLIDVSKISDHQPHLVPVGVNENNGLIDFWKDEVGKLLKIELDTQDISGQYRIGIACDIGFSGGVCRAYPCHDGHALPIVGESNFATLLASPYVWLTDPNIHNRTICFEDAKRNIEVFGCRYSRRESSHHQYIFEDGRTWPLDENHSEIPLAYLDELVSITQLPLNVIRHTLVKGELPKAICFLDTL